jgi:hypothetical protein
MFLAFDLKDDYILLKSAFRWRDAPTENARNKIMDATGVRFSVFNLWPGWGPSSNGTLDLMHNFWMGPYSSLIITMGTHTYNAWLGIGKHGWDKVIVHGYLIDPAGWQRVQDLNNAIKWPSHIGRLPRNVIISLFPFCPL